MTLVIFWCHIHITRTHQNLYLGQFRVPFMSHINIIHVPIFYWKLIYVIIRVHFMSHIFKKNWILVHFHVPDIIIIINLLRFRVPSCPPFSPDMTLVIFWCPIHVPCIWYIFMSHSCPRYYNDFKLLNISCPFMSSYFTWYDIEKWNMKTFDVPFMSYVS